MAQLTNQQPDTWNFDSWVDSDDLRASLKGLLSSDPRSATVLAGSIFDDMLSRLITAHLAGRADASELAEASQLDYSAKCGSVREMGLIGERMLAELRGLGRIRNEFAHNPAPGLDFDSPEVAASVERLRGPEQVAGERNVPGVGSGVQEALEKAMPLTADEGAGEGGTVTGRRYWWTVSVLSALATLGARLHVATAASAPGG